VSNVKKVVCPHCSKEVEFRRNSKGTWVGTVGGAGAGYFLASGLGIAGAVLGASVAIPAALVGLGVGAIIGNRVGSAIDNAIVKCPNCKKTMSI
jgi:ribosomal protein L37AE/L43A